MATNVVLNSVTYSIPAEGDSDWGTNVTNYLIAISTGVLQKSGGTFTLTAEVNFGATYGLKSAYLKSQATNPASAGVVRLGNTETISWRNAANSADLGLTVNASNALQYNGTSLTLAGAIVDADISVTAAIALSKLAALTIDRALVSSGSGVISVSAATATEVGYLSGVTSAIQTQLNSKQATGSYALTTGKLSQFAATSSAELAGVISDETGSGALVFGTSPTLSSPAISSPTGLVKGDVGLGNVDNTSDATKNAASVTLTNKTITSPVITTPDVDILSLQEQGSTPTTPASGKYKIYPKSDGFLYTLNDDGTETKVGAGTGGINYIAVPDGEATTGWTTFADGASYVDGTGGSPTGTWTASAVSPLRGTKSFLWTAGTAGDGVSYAFTIDSADKAKLLQIKFDYEVVTFASMTDNDYEIWIYDVTNGVAIQPTAYQLKNSSLPASGFCNFQSASNSTSYRLSIFQKDGTTSNIRFDNISVGPQVTVQGAAVSDWVSYTPLLVNLTATGTNASNTGKWRRVGDSMEGVITVRTGSTGDGTSASPITFGIPSGYSIDTSKLPTSAAGSDNALGHGTWYDRSAVLLKTVDVRRYSSTELFISIDGASGASAVLGSDIGTDQDDDFSFRFTAPILGWSSNTSFAAESGEGRVVSFSGVKGSTQAVTANVTDITFTSVLDRLSAWNGSQYVVPSSGDYSIAALLADNATNVYNIRVWINGIVDRYLVGINAGNFVSGSTVLTNLRAGDTISLRSTSTQTLYSYGTLAIHKLQGPSAIAAGETVAARYTSTAGIAIPNAEAIVDFATKDYDTHGAVTTGASWKFTAPVSGIYRVYAQVNSDTDATAAQFNARIYNSTVLKAAKLASREVASSSYFNINAECTIKMLAGDYVQFTIVESTDTAANLTTAATDNFIEIIKVGNY